MSNRTVDRYCWAMPRVAPEHLATQRQRIVEAAAQVVAAKGVPGTTMREVITASGLSAGAVYHYFPAKAGLIAAIGAHVQGRYADAVGDLLERSVTPGPAELLHGLAAAVTPRPGEVDLSGVGIAVWAQALHDDDAADSTRGVLSSLRARLTETARRWQAEGHLDADADPRDVGAVLYGLMPGFVLQRQILGDVDAGTFRRGLEALLSYR